MILALLIACRGPTAYDVCVRQWRLACECDDPLVAAVSGDGSPGWACEQDPAKECANFSDEVCDPKSSKFDADDCEAYHDRETSLDIERWDCQMDQVARDCKAIYDGEAMEEACPLTE